MTLIDTVAEVESRVGRICGVTFREAVKYLPEEDRERLLSAYRSR